MGSMSQPHQRLIDRIETEMGEGGPTVAAIADDGVTFITPERKGRTIKILANEKGTRPPTSGHSR